MNKNISTGDFIKLNLNKKVEYYYDFFFEQFSLSPTETGLYKTRIKDILVSELNSYYFDLNHWFVKDGKTAKSISNLQSEFGHLTKNWTIDWAWIIHHIILDFLNIGIAGYLIEKYGSNVLVYKWLPDPYFELAKKVYFKDQTTREPRIFRLTDLLKDSILLNLKTSTVRPNIGVTFWEGFNNEIWDMTELRKYEDYMKWDYSKKSFVYDQEALIKEEKRLGIKGKIKIRIGDKEFEA